VARKFKTPITIDDLGSASSQALAANVDGDSQNRINIDAGGKITWGSGSATGDTTLYRATADTLKTDDAFTATSLAVTGQFTFPTSDGSADQVITTNGSGTLTWSDVSANASVSETPPSSPATGQIWYESDTGKTFVYYDSFWIEVGASPPSSPFITDLDEDTKIQVEESSDEDKIRFDTAGSERMIIDASGNVGIGTTSPAYKLDVAGDIHISNADPYLIFTDTDTNAESRISASSSVGSLIIDADFNNEQAGTNIVFKSDGVERMRINDSGNVGIGTASPSAELHIKGASNPEIRFQSTDSSDPFIYFGDQVDAVRGGIGFDTSANQLQLRGYNNSTRIAIDSSGNVGIGTTSPSDLLHIDAGTSGAIKIGTTGGRIAELTANDSEPYLSVGSTSSHSFAIMTNGSRRLIVDSSGNVGIGDSSPSYTLDVNGTVRSVGKLTASGGIDGLTLANGGISGSNFDITGVNQMTINDEGEGILFPNVTMYQEPGDTDRLTLNGNLLLKATAGPNITIRDTDSSDATGYIAFENNAGTRMGYIGYPNNDDIHLKNENTGGHIFFATQNTYRAYVNSSGHFQPYTSNTYDLGTSSDFWRNAYIAGNIYMGANDYIDYDDSTNYFKLIADGSVRHEFYPGRIKVINTGWCTLGADSTWGRLETDRGKFYINKEIWVDEGKVSSYNENLSLQDSGTTVMTLDAAANVNGSALIYQGQVDSYTDAGKKAGLRIVSRSASSEATGGLTGFLCQTTYSTDRHVHGRVFWSSGDVMTWRNYENTAWTGHQAAFYTVSSSAETKERIRTGRDERGVLDYAVPGPRKMAFKQARKLRPVIFDDAVQETLYEWDGCPDGLHETRDECTEAKCDGKDNMIKKLHVCDDYLCGGTNEEPCWLIERHVDRPGLIAEEVKEIYPKAVSRDAHGGHLGIDYAVITTELINTVTHLLEDRDEMRDRAAAAIHARRRAERSVADLVARIEVLENN
jgi:hypothetical protein